MQEPEVGDHEKQMKAGEQGRHDPDANVSRSRKPLVFHPASVDAVHVENGPDPSLLRAGDPALDTPPRELPRFVARVTRDVSFHVVIEREP